ncbi:2'-5' RNA ligase family protein [Vulcanisaeta distributa]|uniref:2'-5' RNA ligase family protein n=1 Tax=Vulcanisaeta distributa TaxID=164451 RepID=UPI000A531D54|nr:2'-5' RNA ligase family protein [Vulcanisaeta distributa]
MDLTDQLKDPIIKMQREFMGAGVDMKPVEPENLHITLRFIGEVSKDLVEELKKRLGNVRYNQFTMHIRGIGGIPKHREAKGYLGRH